MCIRDSWTFEGGTPSTSNEQNPTVTYSTAGKYKVCLLYTSPGKMLIFKETDFQDNLFQTPVNHDLDVYKRQLINEYGEAVGITSGTFVDGSQANLNYAWSIDVIKPYIKSK